ncbi:class I SAM-dependent methyltransferase [bacterium]|nr:class I SAM-dependent methyltransferase [bacterium]
MMDKTNFLLIILAIIAQANVAIGDEYMGRTIAQTMHYTGAEWLLRESREREEATGDVIAHLGVKPGMAVCDIGCGNGFYTLKLAKLAGETGGVYAVDIQKEMLALLKKRAASAEISNITPVLSTQTDPKLPEGALDLVLMVDVYHEFSHPHEMLQAIRKSLKPNGRIALLEYREEDPEVPIKPLHKMSKRQILKEYAANGFQLAGEYDGLPWQHLMFFQRAKE